jgi:(p)ppGpp synthase/HD superfamily hydrolase
MNIAIYTSLVYQLFSHEEAQQVLLAYRLAKKIHRGQFRKAPEGQQGERYFNHPRRVSLSLMETGFCEPGHVILSLLHDAIEDADDYVLVSALCEKLFGHDIAKDIKLLSKFPKNGYVSRLRASVKEGNFRPSIVKMMDRYDNLKTLPLWDSAFCEKQKRETREEYITLFEGVVIAYPSLHCKLQEIRSLCEE